MSTWGRVNLGSVCQFRYGKSLPAKARSGSSFPVVGSGGVVGYHDQALLNGPGIVVGRKGSIGSVTWLDDPYWPIDTAYYIETDPALIDLRYLFHALKSLPLESMNKSAAIPGLNRDDAYRLEITLPPLDEQRRIADILDRASELQTKVASRDSLLREFLSSSFHDISTNYPAKSTPLGKICTTKPDYGLSHPSQDYSPTAGRYIRITDIDNHGYLKESAVSPNIESHGTPAIDKRLEDGDLLIARSDSPSTLDTTPPG